MNEHIFIFFPMFATGMAGLSVLFKLYKRSVSAFITFMAIAISSNLSMYYCIESGLFIMLIFMIVIMIRAMMKSDTDTFLKQNKRRRRENDNA